MSMLENVHIAVEALIYLRSIPKEMKRVWEDAANDWMHFVLNLTYQEGRKLILHLRNVCGSFITVPVEEQKIATKVVW